MQKFSHIIIVTSLVLTALTACNVQRTSFEDTLSEDQKDNYGLNDKSKLGDGSNEGGGIFAPDKDKAGRDSTALLNGGGTNLQVNRYLWTASLDVASFLPLTQVDAVGGVIISDWYALPEAPDRRYKVNIVITGTVLRADALNVNLFKQEKIDNSLNGGSTEWESSFVDDETLQQFKDSILTRAREIRFFSLGVSR